MIMSDTLDQKNKWFVNQKTGERVKEEVIPVEEQLPLQHYEPRYLVRAKNGKEYDLEHLISRYGSFLKDGARQLYQIKQITFQQSMVDGKLRRYCSTMAIDNDGDLYEVRWNVKKKKKRCEEMCNWKQYMVIPIQNL